MKTNQPLHDIKFSGGPSLQQKNEFAVELSLPLLLLPLHEKEKSLPCKIL